MWTAEQKMFSGAGKSIIINKAKTNEHFSTMRTLDRIGDNTLRDIYIRAVFLAFVLKRGCFYKSQGQKYDLDNTVYLNKETETVT